MEAKLYERKYQGSFSFEMDKLAEAIKNCVSDVAFIKGLDQPFLRLGQNVPRDGSLRVRGLCRQLCSPFIASC